jgi:excinuclease ABC subunit B
MLVLFHNEMEVSRDDILRRLVEIQYERNDYDFHRGTFRVRGDVVDIFPAHEEERAVRLEFFGDFIENIAEFDPLTGEVLRPLSKIAIYPSSHYVTSKDNLERALQDIAAELADRLPLLRNDGKLLEAQRLEQRTRYDLEILRETGVCPGIENYSRHLDGRQAASRQPPCWITFPKTTCCSSTKVTSQCRSLTACITVTARASKPW